MSQELKPCPFCGQQKTLILIPASQYHADDEDDGYSYSHSETYAVMCDASSPGGPGGCGASSGFKPTEAEAVTLWNRRHEVQQPAGDVVRDAEPVSDKELRSLASRYGVDDSSLGALRNFADAYNVAAAKHVGDSARIDWLEQHNEDTYNYDVICGVFGSGFYVGDDPTNKHASLRAAIDAAMASSARKGE